MELTDQVLFSDVWERTELSPRDRSLITVSALVALYRLEQLPAHLRRAMDNGLSPDELATDAIQERIDTAYHAKYDRSPGPVASITAEKSRETTLRVVPVHLARYSACSPSDEDSFLS